MDERAPTRVRRPASVQLSVGVGVDGDPILIDRLRRPQDRTLYAAVSMRRVHIGLDWNSKR